MQLQDYISLVERGVFLQINLLSLINYYSPEVRKKTEDLIDNDLVSFVGTDCHNMGHAELYSRCYNNQLWHDLYNSGKLLNSTL